MDPVQVQTRNHAERVARFVELQITAPSRSDVPDTQTVLAFDILTHALSYAKPEGSMVLWRTALWQRTLPEPARSAVVHMIEQVVSQHARGQINAAAEICNCLNAVIGPHIGGVPRSTQS